MSVYPSSVSWLVLALTSKVFHFFLFIVLDWQPSNQRPLPKDSWKQIVPPPRGLFCSTRASYLLHKEHYEVQRSDLHIRQVCQSWKSTCMMNNLGPEFNYKSNVNFTMLNLFKLPFFKIKPSESFKCNPVYFTYAGNGRKQSECTTRFYNLSLFRLLCSFLTMFCHFCILTYNSTWLLLLEYLHLHLSPLIFSTVLRCMSEKSFDIIVLNIFYLVLYLF